MALKKSKRKRQTVRKNSTTIQPSNSRKQKTNTLLGPNKHTRHTGHNHHKRRNKQENNQLKNTTK